MVQRRLARVGVQRSSVSARSGAISGASRLACGSATANDGGGPGSITSARRATRPRQAAACTARRVSADIGAGSGAARPGRVAGAEQPPERGQLLGAVVDGELEDFH